jgi:acetyl-CoA carboxylase biotin carboxyl carrier protein
VRIARLRQLIKFMEEARLAELEISGPFEKVRLRREGETIISSTVSAPLLSARPEAVFEIPHLEGTEAGRIEAPQAQPDGSLVAVKSPMVGTFYRAPAPDAPPYVEAGNRVTRGQTVCIIEAMKLMNEIEAEVPGVVARILVENAQPVEFGQELLLIRPE